MTDSTTLSGNARTTDAPKNGRTMRPLAQFRWFAHRPQDHTPTLQQAWAPVDGGQIEWRDVPLVYGTDDDAGGSNAA